jgi:hypothetical protein
MLTGINHSAVSKRIRLPMAPATDRKVFAEPRVESFEG